RQYGWETYYYGNAFAPGGRERGWYTFDHRPRFNNNYLGLRQRVAILSEAYAYATFEERVRSSLYFVEEILDFVDENAGEIRRIVSEADARSVVGDSLALRADFARSDERVDILMGAAIEEIHPLTGETLLLRADTQYVEPMFEYGTFRATLRERVPAGYLVPPDQREVLVRLRAHGIETRPAPGEVMDIEGFRIDSVTTAERPFQGRVEQTWFGRWEAGRITPLDGTVWVPADGALGRLAFALLEPRSDDGFAAWGLVSGEDAVVPRGMGGLYPIFRAHAAPDFD
ncbi:MAG: peptidase M14, partial [Gemmatimonadota bacterium]|nr:peptidase M14 [Gemmatimonadota bacterium]